MKIQEDKTIKQAIRTEPQNNAAEKGDAFEKVLRQVQSKRGGAQGGNPDNIQNVHEKPLKVPHNPGVAGIASTAFSDFLAVHEQEGMQKVENLLDALEAYSHALADPGKNLRDVSPQVRLLETGMEELKVLGENLPEGGAIRGLAQQALILAQVEVSRFNRGDYL